MQRRLKKSMFSIYQLGKGMFATEKDLEERMRDKKINQ